MNKRITLYELLGKVKDDTSTSIYIKYLDRVNKKEDVMWACKENIIYKLDQCIICLNDEVEILDDEDKEENKIPTEEEMETFGYNVAKIFKAYEKGVRMALEENDDIEELTYESTFEDNSDMEVQEVLLSKINELVREVNKLKKERK